MADEKPETVVLYEERTPDQGVVRLVRWPEGYVLWHHGEIVWRSWAPQLVTLRLEVDASAAIAAFSAEADRLRLAS